MLISPTPNRKLRRRFKRITLAGATLMAMAVTGVSVARSASQQDERKAWLDKAARGIHEARAFCESRQVFGLESKMPPMVKFYLSHVSTIADTHSSWEIEHDGERVVYLLTLQFEDFDDEMLTRIAALDEQIDDGDLFTGEFQLTLCGFTTRLPGPASSSEKFVSDFRGQATVNPI